MNVTIGEAPVRFEPIFLPEAMAEGNCQEKNAGENHAFHDASRGIKSFNKSVQIQDYKNRPQFPPF
jgi:hypothetical protein